MNMEDHNFIAHGTPDTAILKEVEIQLLEAIGCLQMAEPDEFTAIAKAKLITTVHGLRIITLACEQNPEVTEVHDEAF
jgi:hypothetical protein